MSRFTVAPVAAALYVLGAVCHAGGQEIRIGIIDFYGLSRVSTAQVRQALTFKEGDAFPTSTEASSSLRATESRLAKVPGITRASAQVVCCDQGRAIVFVGIEEQGAPAVRLRAAPQGTARLAADILDTEKALSTAMRAAVERGEAGEDRSQGHALAHDPATRTLQEHFVLYAKRDLTELRSVLRTSSDAAQRAIAAQVLGYAADKQAVVEDLAYGMSDPSEDVRNNAMRALGVFAEAAGTSRPLRIPVEPFIEFLRSPVWTDRNKASYALMALSASRDASLLEALRKEALTPLVEMARWKSEAHALAPFLIVGRIAGYSDDAAMALWSRGDRATVIDAAMKRRKGLARAQPLALHRHEFGPR